MGFDLWILNKYSKFDVKMFLQDICLKSFYIIGAISITLLFIQNLFPSNFLRLILSCFFSFVISSVLIFYVGLNSEIRQYFILKLNKKLNFNKL